ncbi:MAG: protein kinase, partial [Kofleriaceae bacterium]|nr:protein kinase [Kofleriaceae bacterium]
MAQYELLERIGKGGMAEIFRASQTAGSGFEKIVAIKRILPHLSQDQRFIKLLIAEAKILSELHHRNIVQIYDVGLGDDSQYFLVMEFVDGVDLLKMYDDFTGSGRLPVEVALHICSELCEALEHAHIAKDDQGNPLGLVHRDVSPSNVLLSKYGEVKLTDFGIAKQVGEVTGHGAIRGKFAYISPEQAVNKHVDARSDVFSVGILLYELVCGRRLYSGYPDFDALREVRAARVNPSAREIRRVASPLADIIMRALSKRPEDRFQSAGDFGSALRGYRYSLETEIADPRAAIADLVVRQVVEAETTTPKDVLPDYSDDFADDVGGTVVRINTAQEFFSTDLSGLHQLVTEYPEPRFEDMSDERAIAQRLADVDDADEPTRLHQRIPVPPPRASAPVPSAPVSAPVPSAPVSAPAPFVPVSAPAPFVPV